MGGALTTSNADVGRVRKGWELILERWWKEFFVMIALGLVLAAPWLLKPKESTAPSKFDRRLVILTPHNEKIRQEFGLAFTRYWKKQTGETLYVDWRTGGTAELAMLMRSEIAASFEYYWTHKLGKTWSHEVATSFGNSKITVPIEGVLTPAQEARKAFLESDVGMGVDLFFGGGAFDFEQQARTGMLVPADGEGKNGIKAIKERHPDWFTEAIIPASVSGEPFYDRDLRWVGTCLSSLGLCYNSDVMKRLGIDKMPAQWEDLADPRLIGQIALSDPSKSGTVAKAMEQIIQQQIQLSLDELHKEPAKFANEEALLAAALAKGWENGLKLIQRISANARYFTDSATKIPLEVAQGDAAAGMCIDFYGRSFEEQVRQPDGQTRIHFVAPIGGTSVGVDPVGMLRGAPEPEVATAFMEFALSDEGQKLWNFRPDAPGGPTFAALRRLPIRRDFYTPENQALMSDGNIQPFEEAKAFTYHPEWTGSLFNAVRFLVKVTCLEMHDEQQRAWRMMAQAGFPPQSMAVFSDMTKVNFQAAQQLSLDLGKKDKELEMRRVRELSIHFREQYQRAYDMAKAGQ